MRLHVRTIIQAKYKMSDIPVLDFTSLALDKQDGDLLSTDFKSVGEDIVNVLSTTGYVYLIHNGVDQHLIEKSTEVSGQFFALPTEVKQGHAITNNHGWMASETEKTNPQRPGDIKEAFNSLLTAVKWPDEQVPDFSHTTKDLIAQCLSLGRRILKAIGIGLGLQDPDFFVKSHAKSVGNLRYLQYPPMPEDMKPGQTRCGEHTDFGSVTLSFQDNAGGLQLMTRSGDWLDVRPLDGAVLVHVSDLLQRWTTDRMQAVKHRVIFPDNNKHITRRSLIYFMYPDEETVVTCLDGSDKYQPIGALDYAKLKFEETRLEY